MQSDRIVYYRSVIKTYRCLAARINSSIQHMDMKYQVPTTQLKVQLEGFFVVLNKTEFVLNDAGSDSPMGIEFASAQIQNMMTRFGQMEIAHRQKVATIKSEPQEECISGDE